jgi:hypothetical protein
VGVCGSSKGLKDDAIAFCKALGRALVEREEIQLITGGTKQRKDEEACAVEWYVAAEAERYLLSLGVSVRERIVTVPRAESSDTQAFSIGDVRDARGKTSEAKRFAFVRDLDALIAVGGGSGTDQELALAFELRIPVLPVPTFPARNPKDYPGAPQYWDAYRDDLLADLRLKGEPSRVARWEAPPPQGQAEIVELARDMVDTFLLSLPKRCFVIIPYCPEQTPLYEQAIRPALEAVGDEAVNLQYLGLHGDATEHIRSGIQHCNYVIAVLDGSNPNVFYEVGLAHAWAKPTILLSRTASTGPDIPFDIRTQNRLQYESESDALDRLATLLQDQFHHR